VWPAFPPGNFYYRPLVFSKKDGIPENSKYSSHQGMNLKTINIPLFGRGDGSFIKLELQKLNDFSRDLFFCASESRPNRRNPKEIAVLTAIGKHFSAIF